MLSMRSPGAFRRFAFISRAGRGRRGQLARVPRQSHCPLADTEVLPGVSLPRLPVAPSSVHVLSRLEPPAAAESSSSTLCPQGRDAGAGLFRPPATMRDPECWSRAGVSFSRPVYSDSGTSGAASPATATLPSPRSGFKAEVLLPKDTALT